MKKREYGIDLLRCLGLLCVVGVHSFLKNGFYSQPQVGTAMWLADSARWVFFCCNGIFMMLTGYLKSTKPFGKGYYKGLWMVLAGYLMTCVVSFPIRHFLLGEKLTILQWLENFVTFANYGWYVEMYIGLFLISPFLNAVFEKLTDERKLLWFAGTMVLLTALPSITPLNIIPDYWTALYPITYYVIGGVIRRMQPQIKPWLGLSLSAAWALLMGLVSVLSTDSTHSEGFSQGYGGFWVTVLVSLLFISLYRVQVGNKAGKVLAWAAGGCFEGYILSRLLDVWIYDLVKPWHTPEKYLLIFACVTLPVFLFAVLSGKATHSLALLIVKRLEKKKQQVTAR